jgi:hypothetical protein
MSELSDANINVSDAAAQSIQLNQNLSMLISELDEKSRRLWLLKRHKTEVNELVGDSMAEVARRLTPPRSLSSTHAKSTLDKRLASFRLMKGLRDNRA